MTRFRTGSCLAAAAAFALVAGSVVSAQSVVAPSVQSPAAALRGDLDKLMERVLARRDENWKKLHDYILTENERFELTGPAGIRLHGMDREFTWYIRDGFLVRSPVRFDGVAIPDADRQKYEREWIEHEREREKKQTEKRAEKGEPDPASAASRGEAGLDAFVDQRGEPRFVSEAYFMKFKFEPGNYYLVGRERVDDREVLRVEYYPTKLFDDEGEHKDRDKEAPPKRAGVAVDRKDKKTEVRIEADEDEIQRKMNKVALVTLWIDPTEDQIVKYTFDNVDFGFLPGRWLVRLDDVTASMTMGRAFEGVWLPRQISMRAGLTLAAGSLQFRYGRQFSDYKKAETSARIRSIVGGVK